MKQKTHKAIGALLTCTHDDSLTFDLEPVVGATKTVSTCRTCGALRLTGARWQQPGGLRKLFVTLVDPTLLDPERDEDAAQSLADGIAPFCKGPGTITATVGGRKVTKRIGAPAPAPAARPGGPPTRPERS
jgi:hypothetical protein